MKKLHLILILSSLFASVLTACKKNVLDPTYKGETQLIIGGDFSQNAVGDSVVFSFAEYELTTTEAQIILNARIAGDVASQDREFKVEVVDSLTTALPSEYEVPTGLKIPAGQVSTVFFLKVKRTARLVSQMAKVVLRVLPGENFKPGQKTPLGHIIASNLSPVIINYGPTYQVNFTDMLTKPATWDIAGFGMNGYVGTWSQVKHKLIIDATGIRNFNALTNAQKYQVQSVAARYLADYNDANPGNPLKNENGVVIKICPGSSCP
jgi:hypothetical protein